MVAHCHLSCNMFIHLPGLEKKPKPVKELQKNFFGEKREVYQDKNKVGLGWISEIDHKNGKLASEKTF